VLTIFGRKHRSCDGITRRSFLRIGAPRRRGRPVSAGDILRARPEPVPGRHIKAVINIWLKRRPPPTRTRGI